MKNALMIFITSVVVASVYNGGNTMMVASWYLFACGITGILIGISHNGHGDDFEKLRERLVSRNMFVFLISEIVLLYPLYVLITSGYVISSFVYFLGSVFEIIAVFNLKSEKAKLDKLDAAHKELMDKVAALRKSIREK